MKFIKTIILLVIIGGILFVGRNFLFKKMDEIKNAPIPKKDYISVNVIKPKEGVLSEYEEILAKLKAKEEFDIKSKLPLFIKKIYVKEGDFVKKGTILVRLDNSKILSDIASLKETLSWQIEDEKLAFNIYKKNLNLYKVGGLSKEKLDSSFIAYKAKKSKRIATEQKIKSLNSELNYYNLKAPQDMVISKIYLHKGDLAIKPILSGFSKKELIFSYTKNDIKVGNNIYYNNDLIAKVSLIYPSSNDTLFNAKATLLKDINLPINSNITIKVLKNQKIGCILPNNALVHKKDGVYLIELVDEEFKYLKVDIILEDKNKVLISNCPKNLIAIGSESKIANLPLKQYYNIIQK